MDSFKDVLEAAQLYCKGQMAEPTYNLYIDGLEPVSFEDSRLSGPFEGSVQVCPWV